MTRNSSKGSIKPLFPSFFYHGKIDNHAEIKPIIISEIAKAKLHKPPWGNEVESSFNSSTNQKDFSWTKVAAAFRPHLENIHHQLGGKPELYLFPAEFWVNVYKKGYSQEVHTHAGGNCLFSCAYFVQYDKTKDAAFTFYNTDPLFELDRRYKLVGTTLQPEVEEGDIIIFPSQQSHFVTTQKVDSQRITISSNISTNQKPTG